MHKVISTSTSIIIIAACAFFVATYTIVRTLNLSFPISSQALAVEKLSKKSAPVDVACQTRAFQGDEKISVWQIMKDGKAFVKVAKEDISKLPFSNIDNFRLIDQTPAIEEQLASSSEENPVQISITGFATLCDGTAFAALSYSDGLFSEKSQSI